MNRKTPPLKCCGALYRRLWDPTVFKFWSSVTGLVSADNVTRSVESPWGFTNMKLRVIFEFEQKTEWFKV